MRAVLGLLWRVLTRPVLALGHHHVAPLADEQADHPRRARLRRFVRFVLRRLLLAPVMLVLIMGMLVFGTTHRMGSPSSAVASGTPLTVNLFYRDVTIPTADKETLAGWYIPAWSADRLMQSGEQELRQRRAGLVLCHGAWADKSQLLWLTPALHEAGYELLLIDLRGCGDSTGQITLGLSEWLDVQAATTWLRKVGQVDSQRIGLIASDTNVSAAMRVASADPSVRVVVADRPCRTIGGFVRQRFDAIGLPGHTLGRLYEWSFALSRGANLDEASSQRWAGSLSTDQSLMVTARNQDPHVPQGDPLGVLKSAPCLKVLQVNPFPIDGRGQPAILPAELVSFLRENLPAVSPSAHP